MGAFVPNPTTRRLIGADLYCGAGGASTGIHRACLKRQLEIFMTVINHDPKAIATYNLNHPGHRPLIQSVSAENPRNLFPDGRLDFLWASPECVFHSNALGGAPIDDQRRSGAWAVVDWIQALLPPIVIVENVPEFVNWCPLDPATGRPDKRRLGETFNHWFRTFQLYGYTCQWKIITCANYGDPTTRQRFFMQAVRPARSSNIIVPELKWPSHTHSEQPEGDLMPWVNAEDIIDWSQPMQSIYDRKKPLALNTVNRIDRGLQYFLGDKFIVRMNGTSTAQSIHRPLSTVVASGIKHLLAEPVLLERTTSGMIRVPAELLRHMNLPRGFLVKYYGSGTFARLDEPLDTVTTRGRFGLVKPEIKFDGKEYVLDILLRMLTPLECARAQGFPDDYRFAVPTKEGQIKQIGNAVPVNTAEALAGAALDNYLPLAA